MLKKVILLCSMILTLPIFAFPALSPEWWSLSFPVLPPPRIGSSLVLNPYNEIALLFGGTNSATGELNDLWITDGTSWMEFHTPLSPEPRAVTSMAYDEANKCVVLFGGFGDGALLGDTWLFNGVNWIKPQLQVSPSSRSQASMAYDPEQEVTVLFGGMANTGSIDPEALNEMWMWDGNIWKQEFPDPLPPPRWGAVMVYDPANKSILLFGGTPGAGFLEDTWLWNGTSWIELHPMHHPAGRANFGMAYDEETGRVILFGGQTHIDVDPTETWSWDGQDWSLLPTRLAPPEEMAYYANLVYLPDLESVMLYNTLREKTALPDGSFTYTESSESWILAYRYLFHFPVIYAP